jgi:RNA polymerase sigma factor (sigma-70 family)
MTGTHAGAILRHVHKLAGPPDTPDGELLERFAARREGPAFEALLRRYGPMVLGVCRRVLGNLHDAEDAFQATFLTLASKAGSICKQQSVGSWLYGVAFRVAARARGQAADRRRRESQAPAAVTADPLAELTGRELLTVLDEELQGLAERCRLPLVLCYLQGLTCDEAARRAGWSLRTFKRRLEQGRQQLRGRLARRGLALPAALMAAGLTQAAAPAVPAHLAGITFRAALHNAAGEAPSAGEAAAAGAAAAGGWAAAFASLRIRLVGVVLLGCLLACGAAVLAQQGRAPREPQVGGRQPGAVVAPQKPALPKGKGLAVAGRVLGADGKPLAGADVAVVGVWRPTPQKLNRDYQVLAQGKTDAQGRFRLSRKDLEPGTFYLLHVLVGARGHGLGWRKLADSGPQADVELRLEVERVIRGRLFDLQGLPARGVKGRPAYVAWNELKADSNDKAGQMRMLMEKQRMGGRRGPRELLGGPVPFRMPFGFDFFSSAPPEGLTFWPRPFTTDAQGRFEVRGFAVGQHVHLLVEDDRFATQELLADTSGKQKAVELNRVLTPPQRLEGRVLAADTGKPIAGARLFVASLRVPPGPQARPQVSPQANAVTDAQGRFALNPYPGESFIARTTGPLGGTYLHTEKRFEWVKGDARKTVDFTLPRGVEIRGKLREEPSGKPLGKAARLAFTPRKAEKERGDVLRVGYFSPWSTRSAPDGSFHLLVPPGPGHLVAEVDDPDLVMRTVSEGELLKGKPGGPPHFYHAVVPLEPKLGQAGKEVEVKVRRGVTLRGTVVGPDGKRVRQGSLFVPEELQPRNFNVIRPQAPIFQTPRAQPLHDGRFVLRGCDPEATYRIFVVDAAPGMAGLKLGKPGMNVLNVLDGRTGHFEAKFAAVAEVSAAKAKGGEVTVKLQPCGTAELRVLDNAGKPAKLDPWLEMELTPDRGKARGQRLSFGPPMPLLKGKTPLVPDAKGWVRIRGLIPGATYRLMGTDFEVGSTVRLGEAFTVESAKTRKLPDVTIP